MSNHRSQRRAFLGYVRISRVGGRDGDSFQSPERQREAIHGQAAALGVQLVDVYEDRDVSGSVKADDRDGLGEILRRVEAGEVDGVIVSALDRFGRGIVETHRNLDRITAAGAAFVSVTPPIDTSDRGGWVGTLILGIFSALAQAELERVRESWELSRKTAVTKNGVQIGAAPFGYVKLEDGTLAIDPETAPLVAEVFQRRAAGASWRELAAYLNEHSKTSTGAEWQTATVSRIVDRPTYLGQVRSGAFVREGAHDPIVTRAEYEAARRVGPRNPTTSQDGGPLLSGLVRCSACRYTAQRASGKSRVGKGGRGKQTETADLRSYRCKGQHGAGKCPAPFSMAATKLDAYVEAAFLERARGRVTVEEDAGDLESATRLLEAADAELAAFVTDTGARARIGEVAWQAGLDARIAEVDEARDALGALGSTETVLDADLADLWPTLKVEERRRLLAATIDVVWVKRDGQAAAEGRVFISWHGDGTCPEGLPRRGRAAVALQGFEFAARPGVSPVPGRNVSPSDATSLGD